MNYFVTTSGTYGTNPLTTNRLSDFGMVEDPYNTGRLQPAGMQHAMDIIICKN